MIVKGWKPKNFNPRSLAGATLVIIFSVLRRWNFNPRSLAGATVWYSIYKQNKVISIHAPSRERLLICFVPVSIIVFQSTLPRGSDIIRISSQLIGKNFNPRSLAGATYYFSYRRNFGEISIHAPSRERLKPYGHSFSIVGISIHAPSRERQITLIKLFL